MTAEPTQPARRTGRRKPLHPECNGSVTCTVEGHVTSRRYRNGWSFDHIPLTQGQRKTLRERQA